MIAECRICLSSAEVDVRALPETMFRSNKIFDYFICRSCGCMQIMRIPGDMSRFYPGDYYSYREVSGGILGRLKVVTRTLLSLHAPAPLFRGKPWYEMGNVKAVKSANIRRSAKILDVGCGSGVLLAQLRDVGYRNVSGVDPYIPNDLTLRNGVQIRKCEIAEVQDRYDVVMMHHSLEHVWDQRQTMAEIHRILKKGGHCIIRVPTVDSHASEEYGAAWAQLDPPRHFYLHSRRSITQLLETSGFRVTAIVDDPSTWSLLASEKIKRGMPLVDENTNGMQLEALFTAEERAEMWRASLRHCASGRGDQITVHAERL